ncbi:thiol-disulfide oxidoreductase DCC family protein [Spirosoma spitsbergense]|uniref:thiol-disulfide oxidoreductase DCC family protein n=1 Tax=Spirosoma spitsbergense TaxID=431554 RepID=UPI0004754C44|nr:DCC1-like thiol-disulfide oxidoreductase family protein [Spirosoma spitsbergense]
MNATIVFDGVCGFCNACVQFVISRDPTGYFSFVARQSILGQELWLKAGNPDADSIVLLEDNVAYSKSEAVLRIGRRLKSRWQCIWWLRYVPLSLRDTLYDKFARHRYIFGKAATCQLLTPDQQKRILTLNS